MDTEIRQVVSIIDEAGRASYRVVYISPIEQQGTYIQVYQNGKNYSKTDVPLGSDVKNFQIDIRQEDGFLILYADWGGGKYFYERTFYFEPTEKDLVLFKVVKEHFMVNYDDIKTATMEINPPQKMTGFNLMDYIDNE